VTPPQPLTRSELLRGSAALGVAALVGGWSGPAAAAVPRRGGTFRVGVSSGSAADLIDGQTINTRADQARLVTAWETLLEYDSSYRLAATGLAEEVTSSSPRTWTIRVRDGIEFSNGKTFGADDVIYSIRRMLDRRLGLPGGLLLTSVDPDGMRKLDRRTVRLTLKRPDVTIPDALAQYPATWCRWATARGPSARPGRTSGRDPTSCRASRPASAASIPITRTTGAADSRTSTGS
jgi:peptide/nickel transport system substrate-binding protein